MLLLNLTHPLTDAQAAQFGALTNDRWEMGLQREDVTGIRCEVALQP
ncbi:MAG: hypothetical protein KJZ86_07965 [Caldilineaceae bacterium]|nr:hypothetical protein [Caldilineaceae bacterium]HRJ41463.1 hypothetical protein [Caldilineaceae bacterium]